MEKYLSRTLPNGNLAILDRAFMQKYFAKRLSVFFPENQSLIDVAINDQSGHAYKKTIRYILTLSANGRMVKKYVRANIPSLDTDWEIDASFEAASKLYKNGFNKPPFEVYRPLAKDHILRFFLYEEHAGETLECFIKRRPANLESLFEQTALWLSKLANLKMVHGLQKKMNREKQEIDWFLDNFHSHFPSYAKIFEQMFKKLWERRLYLAPYFNHRLIHGDFQPKNILVARRPKTICVIDFGNSWRYDSASDAGQFCALSLTLSLDRIASLSVLKKMAEFFINTYLKNLAHPDRFLQKKINFFTVWWLLQNASFQITQNKTAREKKRFSNLSLNLAHEIMRQW